MAAYCSPVTASGLVLGASNKMTTVPLPARQLLQNPCLMYIAHQFNTSNGGPVSPGRDFFLVGGVSSENAVGARVGYIRNRRGRRSSLLGSTSWHSCQLHTGDGCCVTGKAGAFILWRPGELH